MRVRDAALALRVDGLQFFECGVEALAVFLRPISVEPVQLSLAFLQQRFTLPGPETAARFGMQVHSIPTLRGLEPVHRGTRNIASGKSLRRPQ